MTLRNTPFEEIMGNEESAACTRIPNNFHNVFAILRSHLIIKVKCHFSFSDASFWKNLNQEKCCL